MILGGLAQQRRGLGGRRFVGVRERLVKVRGPLYSGRITVQSTGMDEDRGTDER